MIPVNSFRNKNNIIPQKARTACCNNILYTVCLHSTLVLLLGYSACTMGTEQTEATAPSAVSLPDSNSLNASAIQKLKNACQLWYDTTLKVKNFNGGIIVAKNGQIIFEQYEGTAHLPGKDTITANTPLHIASITKTFTAMAVLKLWENNLLNIDDEFSQYFPDFNYPGVTIRNLLNHRSGLPNYAHFLEKNGWDKKKFVNNEAILNFLINQKNTLENIRMPDTHFSYCNTNYALLALLIEKVTGKKYADFLKETFFIPLQMKNTFVFALADTTTATASYDWKSRKIPFDFLDAVYGDKNIYTTPRNLLIWDRALKNGKLFTPETLQQAYTPYSNEKPGIKNYGLGWRMNIYDNGKKIIFHNGWWHGCNALFHRLMDEDVTIIVIGNKFTRNIYQARILANLFGDYHIPSGEEEADTLKPVVTTKLPEKSVPTSYNRMHRIFKDQNK